jgi:hypothetical protein
MACKCVGAKYYGRLKAGLSDKGIAGLFFPLAENQAGNFWGGAIYTF